MDTAYQFHCPWCGEVNDSFFDISQGNARYIEDCQVCCRPINFSFVMDETGEFSVDVDR